MSQHKLEQIQKVFKKEIRPSQNQATNNEPNNGDSSKNYTDNRKNASSIQGSIIYVKLRILPIHHHRLFRHGKANNGANKAYKKASENNGANAQDKNCRCIG